LPFAEYTVSESPLRKELVHSTVELKDGLANIPQGPGLGVELNMDIVKKYRVDV
jgi:D-galactarolactone cycloisomerase